jgi:hypothetical protein
MSAGEAVVGAWLLRTFFRSAKGFSQAWSLRSIAGGVDGPEIENSPRHLQR